MAKKIKICGIKSREAIEGGINADYLGFVVGSPQSSRNLGLNEFSKLCDHVTTQKSVAVTVNDDPKFLRKVMEINPDVIQLHGAARNSVQNIDFSFGLAYSKDEYRKIARRDFVDITSRNVEYLIIDSFNPHTNGYGGTGKTWDWELLPPSHHQVLIAGGISRKNFQRAIHETDADGIDISSSVEVNGDKDPEQISRLVEEFRRKYQ